MDEIRVVSYGLGPIGLAIAELLVARPGVRLVGAVDVDSEKVGRDLGELTVVGTRIGVVVERGFVDDGGWDASAGTAGVVVHATSSRLHETAGQLAEIVEAGWNVVSTCEELAEPWSTDATTAAALDAAAKEHAVTVLGAGVNPGFLLDALVLVLTGVCVEVEAVRVRRVVDTNARRVPLQRKAGIGMTEEGFAALAAQAGVGHVGLRQSAHLVARGLGWPVDGYTESLRPVLAGADVATGLGQVGRGRVLGQHQVAELRSGSRVITLDLEMSAGAAPVDRIEIDGMPPVRQEVESGINGDVATKALIANLVPVVARAAPGLLTMAEVLPLHCAAHAADIGRGGSAGESR